MSWHGGIISEIEKGSLGEELGLSPGDVITHINDTVLRDIIDYKLLSDEGGFSLSVKRNGSTRILRVKNPDRRPPGIFFKSSLFDGLKKCRNKCIFCFIDQLPKGLRQSLYLKDDDYRLSFLYGNFITLNNLGWEDVERIIACRLSPLYLSLHSTNAEVRSFMMGNSIPLIPEFLRALSEAQIALHVQVVLCPGINDGRELDGTLNELYGNLKCVSSVGIVPVGLTRFRRRLYRLRPFRAQELRNVILQVEAWRTANLPGDGANWVYLADEFYLGAGACIPESEDYDDYPQIENGIGLARGLMETIRKELASFDPATIKGNYVIATGKLAEGPLRASLAPVLQKAPARIEIIPVANRLFGPRVTVAGLVAGQDLLEYLRGKEADTIFIPEVMLNSDGLFIDGVSLSQLENILRIPVRVIPWDGSGLVGHLSGHPGR
jgi:putative radical SAM enzyme (TIGR03279 family)